MADAIPRVIYQTTAFPLSRVPDLLGAYATGYDLRVANDSQCLEFLREHYGDQAVSTYKMLPGAHRADLWRYAVLYKHGGIYLDIKTALAAPLDLVFDLASASTGLGANLANRTKPTLFTVLSDFNGGKSTSKGGRGGKAKAQWSHQGILACPPGHPIMRAALEEVLAYPESKQVLHSTKNFSRVSSIFVERFHGLLRREFGSSIAQSGIYESSRARLVLFEERCSRHLASKQCAVARSVFGGPDRYNVYDRYCKCCVIYRTNASAAPIFLTRDPNYPAGWDVSSSTAPLEPELPFKRNTILIFKASDGKRHPVTVVSDGTADNRVLVSLDDERHRKISVPRADLARYGKADWCSAQRREDWSENRMPLSRRAQGFRGSRANVMPVSKGDRE